MWLQSSQDGLGTVFERSHSMPTNLKDVSAAELDCVSFYSPFPETFFPTPVLLGAGSVESPDMEPRLVSSPVQATLPLLSTRTLSPPRGIERKSPSLVDPWEAPQKAASNRDATFAGEETAEHVPGFSSESSETEQQEDNEDGDNENAFERREKRAFQQGRAGFSAADPAGAVAVNEGATDVIVARKNGAIEGAATESIVNRSATAEHTATESAAVEGPSKNHVKDVLVKSGGILENAASDEACRRTATSSVDIVAQIADAKTVSEPVAIKTIRDDFSVTPSWMSSKSTAPLGSPIQHNSGGAVTIRHRDSHVELSSSSDVVIEILEGGGVQITVAGEDGERYSSSPAQSRRTPTHATLPPLHEIERPTVRAEAAAARLEAAVDAANAAATRVAAALTETQEGTVNLDRDKVARLPRRKPVRKAVSEFAGTPDHDIVGRMRRGAWQ